MKVGFWTLGMPRWSNAELAQRASELGYKGVNLGRRNLGEHGFEASQEEMNEVMRTFSQAGVEVDLLGGASNRSVYEECDSDKVDWGIVEAELIPQAQAAAMLGIPHISIRIQRPGHGVRWDWTEYLDGLARTCLGVVKETPGVSAVFENHVESANARQLMEMVERAGDDRLGVTFSPDHCLVMQEDALALADEHAATIQHVCLADRRPVEEDLGKFDGRYYYVRYEACVVGEGTVPTKGILETLDRRGYEGFVMLKWEKSDPAVFQPHNPNGFGQHLPDGEVVLPSFIQYIRSLGVAGIKA